MKLFHKFAAGLFVLSGVLAVAAVFWVVSTVKAQTASQLARQIVLPIEDLPFPSGGNYTIPNGSTGLNATYKYAPQIKGMSADVLSRFGANNSGFDTFLGQARKGIYFAFTNYAGIAGRWDISDPFSPSAPDLIRLSHGVYGGNGPLNDSGFAHDGHYMGGAVAENKDGTARFALGHGMLFNNNQGAAVVNFDGGLSFGQSFDESDSILLANRFNDTATIADDSETGRAFLYSGGSTRFSNSQNVTVFDMTDASGGFSDNHLKKSGSIPWANAGSLAILKVPGQSNHVLAAKIGPVNGSGAATGEIRLAEIAASTGLPVASKSYKTQNVSLTAAPYDLSKGNKEIPMGDLQSAVVGGQSYLFVGEKFVPTNLSVIPFLGTLTIGVYKLNASDLTLSRVGSVVVGNTLMGYWRVLDATDGSAPLILVFKDSGIAGKVGKYVGGKYYMDNDFMVYSTLAIFNGSGNATVSTPAFTIPAEGFVPFEKGGVITAQWPAQGFIQPSGTAKYLYLYRNSFTNAGATDELDYEFPDQQYKDYWTAYYPLGTSGGKVPSGYPATTYTGTGAPVGRGYASLRIDRIDVSAFTGGVSTTVNPNTGGGGTGGGGFTGGTGPVTLPPAPSSTNKCFNTYRNLCDAVQALQAQFCKLIPDAALCKANRF